MKWVALGAEVSADRSRTWVALAGVSRLTKRVTVDLHEPLPGAATAPALIDLYREYTLRAVAIDPSSPSATLVAPLEAAVRTALRLADARGMAAAHGTFWDLLSGDQLRIRGGPALDAAVRLADSRRRAGAAVVDRYAGADMGPLLAAELACWALGDPARADGDHVGCWVLDGPPGPSTPGSVYQPVSFHQPPAGTGRMIPEAAPAAAERAPMSLGYLPGTWTTEGQ